MSVDIRTSGDAIDVSIDGADIAHYATRSDVERVDLSKPHVHPLRTRAGVEVTGFAPEDHPWHHGLQFAFPRVAGHNLWGGGTFHDLERGYTVIDDHGEMRHDGWTQARGGDDALLQEHVRWLGHDGESLLDEERTWEVSEVAVDGVDGYRIDFRTRLRNESTSAVQLATPAGRGRPDGGYGGLFLRLAEDFAAEGLTAEDGAVEASGHGSRTLVVHGRTGSGEAVTLGLSFRDAEGPGVQKWLYRFDPFSAIGWAHAYDADLEVPAEGALDFSHRLVVLDGHVDAAAVRAAL